LRQPSDKDRFPSPIHDQDGDQNNRLEPFSNRPASLYHIGQLVNLL
jgi:hypothetical protein